MDAEHGQGKTRIFVGNWQPSAYDLQWARQMVRVLKDKGRWQLPESDNVYQIDHEAKTFDLIAGTPDETFSRNFLCFGRIGYLVHDARGQHPILPEIRGKVLIVPDGEIPTPDNSVVVDLGDEEE
jgi:hypothetical protein